MKIQKYIDSLQSNGIYTFTKSELLKNVKISESAINMYLYRKSLKNEILLIRRGFYVIVPLEYRSKKIIPPVWFIDGLMNYLNRPYYISLLSAAAYYGAAHQQPQVFQVMTDRPIRILSFSGLKIIFITKSNYAWSENLEMVKTENGYVKISSPELTALDIIKYQKQCGGLNIVAGVLKELAERIRIDKVLNLVKNDDSIVNYQRLGFMMEFLGFDSKVKKLNQWVINNNPKNVLLDCSSNNKNGNINLKWNIIENCKIEVDVL